MGPCGTPASKDCCHTAFQDQQAHFWVPSGRWAGMPACICADELCHAPEENYDIGLYNFYGVCVCVCVCV